MLQILCTKINRLILKVKFITSESPGSLSRKYGAGTNPTYQDKLSYIEGGIYQQQITWFTYTQISSAQKDIEDDNFFMVDNNYLRDLHTLYKYKV